MMICKAKLLQGFTTELSVKCHDHNLAYYITSVFCFLSLGNARVENAEFYHMGQEGYIDYEDPRFALAYLKTGQVTDVKSSYIRQVFVCD